MIQSVDPDHHHQLLGLGRIGLPVGRHPHRGHRPAHVLLHHAEHRGGPHQRPVHPPGPGQGHEPGRGPEDHRGAAGPAGRTGSSSPTPPTTARPATPPTTPPGRRSWSTAYKAQHGTPTINLITIPDPLEIKVVQAVQQMWEQVGFDVTITEVRAGHHHRRLRARQVPGGHLLPVRGGQPRPQLRVVEHHHHLTGREHRPQLHPPRRPADRDGAARGTPHHQPVHPGVGLPDGQRAAGQGPGLPVDRAVPFSRGGLRTGSRTSTTRPSPTDSPATAFDEGIFVPTQIWLDG